MLDALSNEISTERRAGVQVVPLSFDRATHTVALHDPSDSAVFADARILLIDSSVYSGASMLAGIKTVRGLGGKRITSYSLVIKHSSTFVPNFFGLMIADHDRAFFQLEDIPNNRLVPYGVVRTLTSEDVRLAKDHIETDVPSITATTWSDLWYEVSAKGNHVYVYEVDGCIGGFVSFVPKDRHSILIDGIAVDNSLRGLKVGGALFRWAETWARSRCFGGVELWAYEARIEFYEHMGYTRTSTSLDLGKERYLLMRRKLLYNLHPSLA